MFQVKFELFIGSLPKAVLCDLARLNGDVFKLNETEDDLAAFFASKDRLLTITASKNGQLVGYKIGFATTNDRFESWRGAIAEQARRQGVAAKLMRLQHAHCLENGFRTIETVTNADNRPMLILNLKSGFNIVRTFANHRQVLKVGFEKTLVSGHDAADSTETGLRPMTRLE